MNKNQEGRRVLVWKLCLLSVLCLFGVASSGYSSTLVFGEFLGPVIRLDAVLATACDLHWDIIVAWDCEALIDAQALLSDLAANELWRKGDHVASALVLAVEDEAAGSLASLLAPDGFHAARVFALLQVNAVCNADSLAAECHLRPIDVQLTRSGAAQACADLTATAAVWVHIEEGAVAADTMGVELEIIKLFASPFSRHNNSDLVDKLVHINHWHVCLVVIASRTQRSKVSSKRYHSKIGHDVSSTVGTHLSVNFGIDF